MTSVIFGWLSAATCQTNSSEERACTHRTGPRKRNGEQYDRVRPIKQGLGIRRCIKGMPNLTHVVEEESADPTQQGSVNSGDHAAQE